MSLIEFLPRAVFLFASKDQSNTWRTNNEVAGFKFATVGVLYAVLLVFAVVVVWEKFNQAESEVAKESGAAATIFRLTGGIDPETELPFARR
jgi:hypothetical protein